MLQGKRRLSADESFEDWVLSFDHMAAPDWCAKYIDEKGLGEVQSDHAIFKISTPTAIVRLNISLGASIIAHAVRSACAAFRRFSQAPTHVS